MSQAAHIWVTSTPPGGNEIAQALTDMGLDAFCAPLLEVVATATTDAQPDDKASLAFTSINGVRAFCALSDRRHWPIYTVGDSTANAARAMGFEHVKSAHGDVDSLIALIAGQNPERVVHMSGVHVAGDLTGALIAEGIDARRSVIYGTQPAAILPLPAYKALQRAHPLVIALLSPRGAQTLMRHWPDDACAPVTCVGLSPAIVAALGPNFAAECIIAPEPSRESLLATLVKVARPA